MTWLVVWQWSAKHAYHSGYAQGRANYDTESTGDQVKAGCNGFVGSEFIRCRYEVEKSAADRQQAEYDLQAQRDMAEWAFWMLLASCFGIILSGGGIVLVWNSLALNRQAIRVAQRAISEQERPYIFLDNIEFETPPFVDTQDGRVFNQHPAVTYKVSNYSSAPASIKESHAQVAVAQEIGVAFPRNQADTHQSEVIIPGSMGIDGWSFYRFEISEEEMNLLSLGRAFDENRKPTRYCLFGYIKYENAFGVMDELGFCWEYIIQIKQWKLSDNPHWNYRKRNINKVNEYY
jgi:hypothetical protein